MTLQADALVAQDTTEAALAASRTALAALVADYERLLTLPTATQEELAALQAEITALQGQIAAQTTQITALQTELTSIKTAKSPGDTTGFTPAEVVAIKAAYNGFGYIGEAVRELTFTTRDTPGQQGTYGPIMRTVQQWFYESHLALSAMLDTTVAELGTPDGDTLEAGPRSGRLARGWFHLNRVIQNLGAAVPATATNANAIRARTIWIPQALTSLRAVNQALPYAQPFPVGYPKIVGPHGSYRPFQWKLWRAGHYSFEGAQFLTDTYTQDTGAAGRVGAYYKALNSWSLVVQQMAKAQVLVASVCFSQKEVDMGPFFRLLSALQVLTQAKILSATQRLHEVQDQTQAFPVIGAMGTVRNRITDSWRHLDDAIWMSLVFPDNPNQTIFPGL